MAYPFESDKMEIIDFVNTGIDIVKEKIVTDISMGTVYPMMNRVRVEQMTGMDPNGLDWRVLKSAAQSTNGGWAGVSALKGGDPP